MPTRRATHGPIFSVTSVVFGRYPVFTQPAYLISLYDALHFYLPRRQVRLVGYVFMPDHLHLLLWPHDPAELSPFLQGFKQCTAKRIAHQAVAEHNTALLSHLEAAGRTTGRCEHKLWQDGSWTQDVFSARFIRQKLNYLHRNPVRAGMVANPDEYHYSSFRNYVHHEEWMIAVDRTWAQ